MFKMKKLPTTSLYPKDYERTLTQNVIQFYTIDSVFHPRLFIYFLPVSSY